MSRILRRPMFRGGRVSAYGTGIASGLADGGMAPDGRYKFNIAGLVSPSMATEYAIGQGTLRTGGQLLREALTPFQKGLYGQGSGVPNWMSRVGGWLTPGRIAGLASRTGLGTLPLLYAGGAQLLQESLPEELQDEGGIYDRAGYADPMSAGADIAGTGVDEVLAGEVDMTKYEDADKTVTGIEGPAGIDLDEFKEKEVNDETAEPVELTAKEMVTENKKLFAELLGSKKARGQDISEMLLGFAGAEGDTVWDKSKAFFRDEAKRPGKVQKINETAAALAINDYIAGKRSLENLKQTLGVVDYKIKASIEASQLKGGSANWLSDLDKEATSQKGGVTDLGVIRSVLFKTTGKNVSVVSKDKKSLDDVDTDDLNIGFNIVSHKGGKTIIEKFEDGTVKERTDLPIT